MNVELSDLNAFLAVARAGGFREAARASGGSASGLSEAVRRLETRLGVRLLNRTTRSVALTDAGAGLLGRLGPALNEVQAALDVVNGFRDRPTGTLRLNVPVSAARLVLPAIVPVFLAAYPEIRLEVIAEESFVDVLAAGCDAGIRYDERLEKDMIAVPVGPRVQRFAVVAAPSYLDVRGRPSHPKDLLNHVCIRHRFASGAMHPWEFERDGEVVKITPAARVIANSIDLEIAAAIQGLGLIATFEGFVEEDLKRGTLEPVLQDWLQPFSGPFLYYPSRRHMPAPLRAFVDFIKRRKAGDVASAALSG